MIRKVKTVTSLEELGRYLLESAERLLQCTISSDYSNIGSCDADAALWSVGLKSKLARCSVLLTVIVFY